MRKLRLRKDVRASIEAGHPWVYRDALADAGRAGEVVQIVDARGAHVAIGYADEGVIGVRVISRRSSPLPADDLARRLGEALALRRACLDGGTNAFRWSHGEADALPGVVIDVYDAWAVVRFDGPGALAWAAEAPAILPRLLPSLRGVVVRSGRAETKKIDVAWGEAPPPHVEVTEHGMTLVADLYHGQKTGLFLDHRASRLRIRQLAKGRRVLNLYGYTGGFSIAAALGGATRVDTVDVASAALELAKVGFTANELETPHQTFAEDVPTFLERARDRGTNYDLIIGDPPSFAPNEDAVPQAMRSYRALHRACLRRLDPLGLYLAASCSSHIDVSRFERTLREAVEKVPFHVRVLERWGGGFDHPRLVAFPEGDYLKCVLLARGT